MDNSCYTFYIPKRVFYPHSSQQFEVAAHTFSLRKQKRTALMGPSGVGKTTLMRYMAGLLTQTPSPHSHHIAFVGPEDHLLPWLTLDKNIALSDVLQKKKMNTRKVATMLDLVNLRHSHRLFPHQLSTGMRKRVLLARALYMERPILFLDEPFANLDPVTKGDILKEIKTFLHEKTLLFITHSRDEAETFADHIYTIEGRPAFLQPLGRVMKAASREKKDTYDVP